MECNVVYRYFYADPISRLRYRYNQVLTISNFKNAMQLTRGGLSDDEVDARTTNDIISGIMPRKAPSRVGAAVPASGEC